MIIQKQTTGKFQLTWENFPDMKLTLDFIPILRINKIPDRGILIHWQGRPKSEPGKNGRTWGIYSIRNDEYFSARAERIPWFKCHRCQLIDIPEEAHQTLPTAVIYFPDLEVYQEDKNILIRSRNGAYLNRQ